MTRRHGVTMAAAFTVVVGMVGLAYSSVPLYRWFCQVTGFGGTTQVADAAPTRIVDRVITVRFNADVNPKLPWTFRPAQREIKVRLGEQALAFYEARNDDKSPVVGTATFNVTPPKAGSYFNKVECFCFTEQRLDPGRSVDMPVTFFVDPDMVNDRNLDDVTTITLSYTFFKALDQSGAAPREDAPKVN